MARTGKSAAFGFVAALLGHGLAAQVALAQTNVQAGTQGNVPAGAQTAVQSGAQSGADAPAAEESMESLVPDEATFAAWLIDFRERAVQQGITNEVLDKALDGVRPNPDIIRRDRSQNEFTKQIWDYLDTAVSAERIASGQSALARHQELFNAIGTRYGIEPEVVAAIWGLESAYGGYRGNLPVIQSLVTLAVDKRRGAYFERELIEALKIIQGGHVDLAEFKGSWAGASGHTQFMPTSFWRAAVDWDGDGRRNLWGEDPGDALASAAAYLTKNGWKQGLPWGVEAALPGNFPWDQAGERIRKPLQEWRELGVTGYGGAELAPGVDPGTPASVLAPAGHEGTVFLIFSNFQVIETYNTADAYVIAIGTLSDRLAGRPGIRGDWPRGDRALTGDEKKELQQLLLDLGFDPKGVDGIMGPNTIQAVRGFQASKGLVADGYASVRLIEWMRTEAELVARAGQSLPERVIESIRPKRREDVVAAPPAEAPAVEAPRAAAPDPAGKPPSQTPRD